MPDVISMSIGIWHSANCYPPITIHINLPHNMAATDTITDRVELVPSLHPVLPVCSRSPQNTVLRLVCHSLAGTAPVYPADECTLVTGAGHRPLRSADNRTCLVKISCSQFGDCCFATARPTLWNSLPEQLRQPDVAFGQFKRS